MSRPQIRPATRADAVGVAPLLREAGFKAWDDAGWGWLHERNPAAAGRDAAHGWVLAEPDGAVHGFLGNIPQEHVVHGRLVPSVTCTAWVVREAARSQSVKLLQAFFRQPDAELWLSTTANAASAPHYEALKAATPADPALRTGWAWVADDAAALAGRLEALSVGLHGVLGRVGAPALRAGRVVSGRARVARHREVERVERVETLTPTQSAHVDELGEALRVLPGVQVRRTGADLAWRLADPQAPGGVALLLHHPDGLRGVAVVGRHHPASRAPEGRLLDLVVAPGQDWAVHPLLRAAVETVRSWGLGLLYCAPVGAHLAGRLEGLGGQPVPREAGSHWLRAAPKERSAPCADAWRATPWDGDGALSLEGPSL